MLSRHVTAAIAATATTALLATSAAADAATRTVDAGPPAERAAALPPKAGSYTYLCTVHPGMKAKVRVVRKGAPSKAKHDGDPRTPFPRAKAVSFTTPGRFRFICTVHGSSMSGAIEVVS